MNIFFLDRDPRLAAMAHYDRHVIKMIMESVQLLSAAHHILDPDNIQLRNFLPKLTHEKHPCSLWIRQSSENYYWLLNLTRWLCREKRHRWPHKKPHLYESILPHLIFAPPDIPRVNHPTAVLNPPQCMPVECRLSRSAVLAYRQYYQTHKSHIAKYTRRDAPDWMNISPILIQDSQPPFKETSVSS